MGNIVLLWALGTLVAVGAAVVTVDLITVAVREIRKLRK